MSGYKGAMHPQSEEMDYQTSRVIAWGERSYEIDESRSLVMAGSDDRPENMMTQGTHMPGYV